MIYKILFLGDSNVGKSCLIKRFIDDEFDCHLPSTICVDFKIKKFKEEDIKLYMWEITSVKDCQSFLKDAEGVFIIFDITNEKSFMNIPEYITAAKKQNKRNNIPFIILGSKLDCHNDRKILYQDAKKFADTMNMHYFEISSKEGKIENIQQIFNIMYSEIEYSNKKKQNDKELEELEIKKNKKKCVMM
jgi:small GTP-binding protein